MGASQSAPIETMLQQAAAQFRAGRLTEAEQLYRQVLTLKPDAADLHAGLATILFLQGKTPEAVDAFRRALALQPDNSDTLYKLGNLLLREGAASGSRIEESFACFRRHAQLTFAASGKSAEIAHRLQHDREQQEYLAQVHGIGSWSFHLADGGRVASRSVNGANVERATQEWNSGKNPRIIVIDNLLSEDALAKLRRYCWGSTIWRETHSEGYLTAMPEHGLACPLIGQIDEDMRAAYPGILGAHQLRYLWAFKYDSRLSGVGAHADPSLVTFNFWITADDANLDPEHGGLTVWDAAAPADWETQRYIGDTQGCRAYLARLGAKPTTIAYRCNRAVVFSSELFHETDRMHFKEGYTNRRINITMLYGRRRAGASK
ncbi:MAG TPA: tetratricopeptide repeat protein [Rhizomicrobium sp.]|nr:tetratricopeptide repeat protein [Rhizomicrobium sp.]